MKVQDIMSTTLSCCAATDSPEGCTAIVVPIETSSWSIEILCFGVALGFYAPFLPARVRGRSLWCKTSFCGFGR
jgi:hypothetical protein